MIEWPEKIEDENSINIEPFKISEKSICHTCQRYNEKCSMKYILKCETDRTVGKAYVVNCRGYDEK